MFRRILIFAAAISLALGVQARVWGQQRSTGQGVTGGTRTMTGSSSRTGSASSGMSSTSAVQLGATAQQMLQSASQSGHFVGASTTKHDVLGLREHFLSTGSSSYGSSGYGSRARTQTRSAYGMNSSLAEPEVRTRLVAGFDRPAVNSVQVSSRLTLRLEKVSRIQFRSTPQVLVQNGTAILRGVVATEHDRALAEQLVRLGAGIAQVKNELTLPPVSPPAVLEKPSSAARPPLVPSPASGAK